MAKQEIELIGGPHDGKRFPLCEKLLTVSIQRFVKSSGTNVHDHDKRRDGTRAFDYDGCDSCEPNSVI